MANVKSTLSLQDNMSSTLSSITRAMNSTLSVMKSVDTENTNMSKAFNRARQDIVNAEKSIKKLSSNANNLSDSMNKASSSSSSFFKSLVGFGIVRSIFSTITSQLDSAISRFDTMNNYPRVLKNLGLSADDAKISIDAMQEHLTGLPTRLDEATTGVQRFIATNGNVKASTAMWLAMNDAILAGGANENTRAAAIEQLTQAYAKGKPEAQEWKSLQQAMPGQLKQVAKAMGYVSDSALYQALKDGKTTMNDFMKAMVQLDKEGIDGFANFHDQAITSTDGIGTAFTNMKTAISKGLVDLIDNANKSLQEAGLPSIQQLITNAGKAIRTGLQKLGTILGVVIKYAAKVYEFFANNWSKIAPIIYGIVAAMIAYKAVMLIVTAIEGIAAFIKGVLTTATMIATAAQYGFNAALYACPITWIVALIVLLIAIILALVAGLIYLWNTNDTVAYAMIWLWDNVKLNMMRAALAIKTAWYGLQIGIQTICAGILLIIQNMVNGAIDLINGMISALNNIPGVNINTVEKKTFGTEAVNNAAVNAATKAQDLLNDYNNIQSTKAEMNATRSDRVKNRKKVSVKNLLGDGLKSAGAGGSDLGDVNWKDLNNTVGNSNSGKGGSGKAVKTTSTDKNVLGDDDIKLLLDIATRDYKLTYQQVTPNITVTFGDVRETANVDEVLDAVADKLEEIYDASLEVG